MKSHRGNYKLEEQEDICNKLTQKIHDACCYSESGITKSYGMTNVYLTSIVVPDIRDLGIGHRDYISVFSTYIYHIMFLMYYMCVKCVEELPIENSEDFKPNRVLYFDCDWDKLNKE